jgi:hypothetical protein
VGHDRGSAEKLTGPVRLTYGPCSAVEFSNGGCPVRSCNAEASCSTEFAAAAHRIGFSEQNVGRLDVAVQQAVHRRPVGRGLRTVEPKMIGWQAQVNSRPPGKPPVLHMSR